MIVEKFYNILYYLSVTSTLIPLVCGLIRFKTLNVGLRVLFIYIVISALTEILSYVFSKINMDGYYVLQNIFTVLEFSLLATVFYSHFDNKVIGRVISGTILGYLFIASMVLFGFKSFVIPNNITSVIESWILMGLSLLFFFRLQVNPNIVKLKYYPFFWFNCSILIYFATSLVLFLFDKYLETCGLPMFYALWSLHLFANIIYNSLFAIALWTKQK